MAPPSQIRTSFQCLCRLSLFSDPQFVKEHISGQNPTDNDCLLATKFLYTVIRSSYEEKTVLGGDGLGFDP